MIHSTFKKTKSIFTLSCILLITPILQSAPFVYIPDITKPSIQIFDAANNEFLTITNMFNGNLVDGSSIAISPDGKTAYTCLRSSSTGSVEALDTATRYPLLPAIDFGSSVPVNIAITPNGKFAYVTTTTSAIPIIDLTSNTITSFVTLGTLSQPSTIHITPDGLTAYVTDASDPTKIYSINLSTNIAQLAIAVPGAVFENTTISPDSAYLYASDSAGNQILQYDISGSHRNIPDFIGTITYPYFPNSKDFRPAGMVITPDGKTLYFGNLFLPAIGAIDISDPLTPTPSPSYLDLSSILGKWAPYVLAITPDSNTLYLAPTNQAFAINITNPLAPTLTAQLALISQGYGLAITPILPPSSISGCKTKNVFMLQTDYITKLTWTAPSTAFSPAPTSYNIYRDAALTKLAGTVPASGSLEFYEHDRNPNTTTSTYYITSVITGVNGSSQSVPVGVTVKQNC